MDEKNGGENARKNGNGTSEIWRIVATALISVVLTSLAGFIAFGVDNVKHSELDQIMATRAPYIHDKQRITDNFTALRERMADLRLILQQHRTDIDSLREKLAVLQEKVDSHIRHRPDDKDKQQ